MRVSKTQVLQKNKYQITNLKQASMNQNSNSKTYDLETRTLLFAQDVAVYCKNFSFNTINNEYIKQLIRSSGSVGANYIEANESLSKKDFIMRIKICRKEAKESTYWLKLLSSNDLLNHDLAQKLIQESIELKKIFSAIIEKSK